MLEPPALAEEAIAGALEAGFGVRVAGLVFLPVGNDAASWAYRVEVARGPSLFLKVRAGAGAMPGASVPGYLHRHGVPLVLAPRPNRAGAPFVVVDRFALALYPCWTPPPAPRSGCRRHSGASSAPPSGGPTPCPRRPSWPGWPAGSRSGRAGASSFPPWRPRSPGPTRPTRSRARWLGSGRPAGT